jgi:hypothetical protein
MPMQWLQHSLDSGEARWRVEVSKGHGEAADELGVGEKWGGHNRSVVQASVAFGMA